MRTEIGCELRTGCPGDRDKVLDAGRVIHLSADTFCHNGHPQPLPGGIDGGRHTGRSAAENKDIIRTDRQHGLPVMVCPDLVFQFLQQYAEVAASHVERFAIDIDGRNTLYAQTFYFVLVQSSVHHLMADTRVDECHHVQGLHHVGTVRTGKGDVSLKPYLTFQCLDACRNSLIGKVLSLSVSIEDGKEERGELMAVGDTAETDSGCFSISEDAEREPFTLLTDSADSVGDRSDVLYKSRKLCRLCFVAVTYDTERNV